MTRLNEDPLALGVKLVRAELARVESANQLSRYQEDFYVSDTKSFMVDNYSRFI